MCNTLKQFTVIHTQAFIKNTCLLNNQEIYEYVSCEKNYFLKVLQTVNFSKYTARTTLNVVQVFY